MEITVEKAYQEWQWIARNRKKLENEIMDFVANTIRHSKSIEAILMAYANNEEKPTWYEKLWYKITKKEPTMRWGWYILPEGDTVYVYLTEKRRGKIITKLSLGGYITLIRDEITKEKNGDK